MSETENTSSEQQETQAPNKRRSCKIFLAKAAFTLGTLAVFYGGYLRLANSLKNGWPDLAFTG